MTKILLHLVIIVLFIITLSGCDIAKQESFVKLPICDTSLNLDTPAFKKEIYNSIGRINPSVEMTKLYISEANLRSYNKGYDSIAVRLFDYYDDQETDIIEIRKHCEGWVAQFNKIKRSNVNGKVLVEVETKKYLKPKSGWRDFTSKIFDLGITSLPDWSYIDDYNPSTDGYMITVEVATSKYYRIYDYLNPRHKPEIKEARKIVEIMEIIEKELGVKRKFKI
jgi:hypothetical protein